MSATHGPTSRHGGPGRSDPGLTEAAGVVVVFGREPTRGLRTTFRVVVVDGGFRFVEIATGGSWSGRAAPDASFDGRTAGWSSSHCTGDCGSGTSDSVTGGHATIVFR